MDSFLSKVFHKFTLSRKEVFIAQRFFPNHIPDELEPVMKSAWEVYLRKAILTCLASIEENFPDLENYARNGIYLGTAGISYMFYTLSKIPAFRNMQYEFIRKAQEYIKPALNLAIKNALKKNEAPSLLLGNCGIYAVAACVYNATDVQWLSTKYYKRFLDARKTCLKPTFLKCGSDDLFVGRAGYILGYLWLCKELGKAIDVSKLYEICDVIVKSGMEHASKKENCPCPLMYSYYKQEYLGAAHGISIILLALLSTPNYIYSRPNYYEDIKKTIDYILTLQDDEGNFPITFFNNQNEKNDLTQWCHGSAGIIYLMAKAYLLWKEDKYLQCCVKAADNIWKCGLLTKGPGLCHGISGNGYAFLLMYRLTQQQHYLNKAYAFAKFMESDEFKNTARIPDNPFSLFEGIGGTALFLGDLIDPSGASFPFLDVFAVYSVYNSAEIIV